MNNNERPNILLFTTDQHRGDAVGLSGNPHIETPNLDFFVEQGAYFPNAYSELPSTKGARRIMNSGQGNYTCGLIGFGGGEWTEKYTVAQVLADAGYHCLNVGWRNMAPNRKLYGFHSVILHKGGKDGDDYGDWLKEQVGPQAEERAHGVDANGWLGRPWHLDERFHPTNWTVAVTLEQIKKRDPSRPFFMWCSLLRPHSPYDPPQFFFDMYRRKELPQPVIGDWAERYHCPDRRPDRWAWKGDLGPLNNRRMLGSYYGSITHIDYQMGYLIEMLRSWGLWNNTFVLFTADHGDMMGEHHLHRKSYAYEGSARIPFVVRYPAGSDLPTGSCDQVVGLQDVMPTLLEAAGVDVPDTVTGKSVLGAVKGGSWREFFHGEHSPCYDPEMGVQFLTDGREKYIWYPTLGEEQLFDLKKDRQERHDRAGDPDAEGSLSLWRNRLIELLGKRGDGFSDEKKLLRREPGYGPEVGKAEK